MATAQKVRIAYDDTGAGDLAIAFMHGLFEDRSYYEAQVRHFSPRHRVLNIDLRGHGESESPETGYSLDILADDVSRVLDDAGVRRSVLCSHSMALALRVATRRPDLAAGVVLLDGALLLVPPALQRLIRMVEALDGDGWRDALLGFFTSVAGPAEPRVRADVAAAPRFYAAPMLRDIIACNSSVHLRELTALECPLLYVHGDAPLDLDRLRQAQPDAIVEEIRGAGHYLMLTAPGCVNAVLDRFLEVIR